MIVAIGSDHGGYKLKEALILYLKRARHRVFDAGTFSGEPCDYPEFAKKVTKLILSKKANRGILICKSGLGMSITANRQKGIRAALCHNIRLARSSRQHNDANILVLSANYVKKDLGRRMCDIFIRTRFLGGRHARRVRKIDNL